MAQSCIHCNKLFYSPLDLDRHLNLECPNRPKQETVNINERLTSSKCLQFHLIPTSALESMAERFMLGEEKHKDKCWNAKFPDRLDERFVIERLNHIIKHAKIALDKILGINQDDGDDDAGAILFGGAVLAEWRRLINEKNCVSR